MKHSNNVADLRATWPEAQKASTNDGKLERNSTPAYVFMALMSSQASGSVVSLSCKSVDALIIPAVTVVATSSMESVCLSAF